VSTPTQLRTDERRALALLVDGWWVRASIGADGRRRASVQLSKYPADAIPIGWDVLSALAARGYVAEGRRLPGGDRRFMPTDARRAACLAATRGPGTARARGRRGDAGR